MPKGTTFCNDILDLLYNGIAIADIAENDTTAPKTDTALQLHTATPAAGGNQTTNEASYTGYARLPVSRVAYAGYTAAAAGAISNAALIQFGQSSTAQALTFVSTGRDAAGAGRLWHFGALNATLNVDNLIVPQFGIAALTITET